MVLALLKTELARLALQKLAELRPDDVAEAMRSVQRASRRMPLLPALGGLGLGLTVGVAVGVLFAPRAGRETRAALADLVRDRIRNLGKDPGDVPPVGREARDEPPAWDGGASAGSA